MSDATHLLDKSLFPEFSQISVILTNKVFKDVALPDIPLSGRQTRRMTQATSNAVVFLDDRLYKYAGYLRKLIYNCDERFNCKTFDICVSIGKLFNFKLEFYPSLTELDNNMNPFNIETSQQLFDILQDLPFTEQLNTHNLHVEFQYFLSYISEAARSLRKSCSDSVLDPNSANINSFFIIKLLKKFVHEEKFHCPSLYRLLSFCVSFPVSEAVVESWGSTITYICSLKHHPGEANDDISQTGTIDKLTFIKLNGPPPGMLNNRSIFERALVSHFNGNFANHFINTTKFDRGTSIVVNRILNPTDSKIDAILPCFI